MKCECINCDEVLDCEDFLDNNKNMPICKKCKVLLSQIMKESVKS